MKEREELELILNLMKKYNLPLSPILEYAIKEKMEEYPVANTADEERETKKEESYEKKTMPQFWKNNESRKNSEENLFIEQQGNRCCIVNNRGEKVFNSNGKLKLIEGNYCRINYTYSSVSMNLIIKNEDGTFILGNRILNAHHSTPLYIALNERNYLNQINGVLFDNKTEAYIIRVDDIWYDNCGYYADFKTNSSFAPNNMDLYDGEKNQEVQQQSRVKKAPRTCLCIYRKDGSILQKQDAATTFAAAIIEAGPIRVRQLGIYYCHINIVSNVKDQKYGSAQREVENGLYILTHSNTKDKKIMLDRISSALNMGWRVKIVSPDR